jgi:hypothetical protein
VIGAIVLAAAYADGPPVAHTGGFGEPTCHRCHADNTLSDSTTRVVLGIPDRYEAGRSYEVAVQVRHPQMMTGGFQLSARVASGPREGRQAGRLTSVDGDVKIVTADSLDVEYASHVRAPVGERLSQIMWTVTWMAPESGDPVVFHVAANAANGDKSEFGDHIATASSVVEAMLSGPGESGVEREHNGGER